LIKVAPVVLPDLPKLAWAASLDLGQRTLWVLHGSAVECTEEWLVEGTWDGPFQQADFHRSANVFGSGIRIDGDLIHFVPSSALVGRLLYCVHAGRLYVSNSLILLLAITGARLDPAHDYREETLAVRKGFRTYDPTFRVSHPQIQAFSQLYHHNLVVSRDGNISVQPKPTPPCRLESFGDYLAQMSRILQSVRANYTDSARSVTLDSFSTISTGYDSTAASVLVNAIGVTKCFNSPRSSSALPPWLSGDRSLDDATPIARALNIQILRLDPRASGATEDELYFYAAGSLGAETVFGSLASYVSKHCQAAVVFTGHHGDHVWDTSVLPRDTDGDISRRGMTGLSLTEVRLKSGFIHAPVQFIMATQTTALDRISGSLEMEPWVLGTSYDRPIPRRIVEQAGVGREAFGQYKKMVFKKPDLPMNPALRKQFLRFLRSKGIRHVRAFGRINRLYYFMFRLWAYLREFARKGSLTLDPQFSNRLRTRRRLFHKEIDFPHLLHQWAAEVLVQQSTEMLLNSSVDSRWTEGPRKSTAWRPTSAVSSPYPADLKSAADTRP
jgi:hypothetical protein